MWRWAHRPAHLGRVARCLDLTSTSIFMQGHYDAALSIYLRLSDASVFAFIRKHSLLADAVRDAPLLFNVDSDASTQLLVERHEDVVADDVCAALRGVCDDAEGSGKSDEALVWRRRLFGYLHALFERDRSAARSYHDLQVCVICFVLSVYN